MTCPFSLSPGKESEFEQSCSKTIKKVSKRPHCQMEHQKQSKDSVELVAPVKMVRIFLAPRAKKLKKQSCETSDNSKTARRKTRKKRYTIYVHGYLHTTPLHLTKSNVVLEIIMLY